MHCDQIRAMIPEFVSGRLPAYKGAWVSQHLAGCAACDKLAAEVRRPAPPEPPPAPEHPPDLATAEPDMLTLRRPIPRWWWAAVAGIGLASAALGVWTFRHAPQRPVLKQLDPGTPTVAPQPEATPEGGAPVRFQATSQLQDDVLLTVESLTRVGQQLHLRVRFQGQHLYGPVISEGWLSVRGEHGRPVDAEVKTEGPEPTGFAVTVMVPQSEAQGQLQVQVGGITQVEPVRWSLPLHLPPVGVRPAQQELAGVPGQIELVTYGQVNDLLQVELATDNPGLVTFPVLYLRDGTGQIYAPATQMRTSVTAKAGTMLRYPLPKELPLPISLVGDGYIGKNLGPWTIDVNVIES